ncbi:MAG: hypothetical protein IPK60_22175 [Sandaracinaceae bacterium]|nr:hypothetical protein [Sandaracinaceae bacterium]
MSKASLRCGACGGTSLVGPYQFTNFESYVRIPEGVDGVFGRSDLKLAPDSARICRDCGHVMHFVSVAKLNG